MKASEENEVVILSIAFRMKKVFVAYPVNNKRLYFSINISLCFIFPAPVILKVEDYTRRILTNK